MRANKSKSGKSVKRESKKSLYIIEPDDKFPCPITQEVMRDPVIAADGRSYERVAIEDWIKRRKDRNEPPTSPMTGAPLAHVKLTPNIDLRHAIEEYIARLPDLQRQEHEAISARTLREIPRPRRLHNRLPNSVALQCALEPPPGDII